MFVLILLAILQFISAQQCIPNVKGPACTVDTQCVNVTGCVRCASSGFCTDVALAGPTAAPTKVPTTTTGFPTPLVTQCVPGVKGPPCLDNTQCANVTGCVRCASSGYCTDVALAGPTAFPTLVPGTTAKPTSSGPAPTYGGVMNCGPGVPLCGLLTLESGFGTGNYAHPECVVHGLWPEVPTYGTSQCMAPKNSSTPTVLYSCYNQKGQTASSCLTFEQHEWTAHGVCAGTYDAEDFFTQVCNLSIQPLAIMNSTRTAGGNLNAMAQALTNAGYEVFQIDKTNSQVELSCCSGSNGKWILTPVSTFSKYCAF